ncbi:hypothetical protein L596_000345 [Steinernema carpocapsae]|uniref:Uncharacterized protein n=1 Tax=Steinernema carpocapsae TaxID=34508 RepID=A0A4U8UK35_STECR|nr:hypothetical protein L596_000345 [Steinernema carpocapsae]
MRSIWHHFESYKTSNESTFEVTYSPFLNVYHIIVVAFLASFAFLVLAGLLQECRRNRRTAPAPPTTPPVPIEQDPNTTIHLDPEHGYF